MSICDSHSTTLSWSSLQSRKGETLKIRWETHAEFIYFSLGYLMRGCSFSLLCRFGQQHEAALFQHLVCQIFLGLPLMYMQLVIGQYTQLGPIHFKFINPLTHGLGYMFVLTCGMECIKYGLTMADHFLYLLMSIQRQLQWTKCYSDIYECWGIDRIATCDNCVTNMTELSAYLYWRDIYMQGVNVREKNVRFGVPQLARAIVLSVAWAFFYLIMVYGVKHFKKIIKINVITIDTILVILLIVCLINKGASTGIGFIFTASLYQVYNIPLWLQALRMEVVLLALGKGVHIMNGNFLKPNAPSSILCIGSTIATFFHAMLASFVTQACVGIIMQHTNLNPNTINFIIRTNYSMPEYILIPQGIGLLAAPQLWNIGYFLCKILILTNNSIVYLLVIEKSFSDAYPKLLSYRRYMLAIMCILFCLLGVPGMSKECFILANKVIYHLHFDMELLTVTILAICVSYIYGVQRLSDDIHFFLGSQPAIFWKISWYVAPILLVACYINRMSMSNVQYTGSYRIVRLAIIIIFIMPLPISVIKEIIGHLKHHNLVGLFRANERWGPADPEERHLRKIFNPREEIRSRRRYETCQHNCLIANKAIKKIVAQEDRMRMENYEFRL